MASWCNRAGLIVGFVASVLITLSVGKPPSEVYQYDDRGKKVQFAAITGPRFLKIGLLLLAAGFAISFAASFISE